MMPTETKPLQSPQLHHTNITQYSTHIPPIPPTIIELIDKMYNDKKSSITIELPQVLKSELKEIAKELGKSLEKLIVDILVNYVLLYRQRP